MKRKKKRIIRRNVRSLVEVGKKTERLINTYGRKAKCVERKTESETQQVEGCRKRERERDRTEKKNKEIKIISCLSEKEPLDFVLECH